MSEAPSPIEIASADRGAPLEGNTPFSAPAEADMFAQVADVPVESAKPTDKYLDKTSRIAGLALANPQGDVIQEMNTNLDSIRETIKKVGDSGYRAQVAAAQQLEQVRNFSKLINDRQLAQTSPDIAVGAANAAQQAILQDTAQRQKYAMEQVAIDRIQDVAAAGDQAQARMLLNNLEHGDANQVIRDMNTKQLILEREIAKASAGKKDDWLGSAAHFILDMVPLYSSTGAVGNVDIEGGLKGWADWMFSGKRVQMESNTLWNMPLEHFSDYVQNELIPKIKDKSTLLGFEDKSKELGTLHKLARPSGVLTQNSVDGLTNLGWIGPAEFSKALSVPGMLIRNGAKKEATNLLAQAAIDLQTHSAEEAAVKTGLNADEIVANMLPDAVNPDTQIVEQAPLKVGDKVILNGTGAYPDHSGKELTITSVADPSNGLIFHEAGDDFLLKDGEFTIAGSGFEKAPVEAASSVVSMQSGINDIITRTTDIMEQFNNLKQLGRLTDSEMQVAIDDAIAKLETQYGKDTIKDVAIKSIKLSDGTSFKRVEFTLGEFQTPTQAIKFAQEMGLGTDMAIEGFATNADRTIRVVHGVPTVKQPLFPEWFKNSKVTMNHQVGGEPRKMYHGTAKDFVSFSVEHGSYKDQHGAGALFFAEDPKTTKGFNFGNSTYPEHGLPGKTIPVYINVVNPFDPRTNLAHRQLWKEKMLELGIGQKKGSQIWDDVAQDWVWPKNVEFTDSALYGYWGDLERSDVQSWIKSLGHDGTYIFSESEGRNLMVYDMEKVINAIEPSDLNGKVVRDESGQYSFRMSKDVSETGFHTEVLSPQATGFLSRVLLSARAVGDRLLANFGQAGGNTRAKLLKTFATDYSKVFSSLSKGERNALGQVLARGEQNAEWYNPDQLEYLYDRAFKRPPTTKELTAYNAARNLNDIEYLLRNDEVYKQKVVSGFESVTFDNASATGSKVNARVVEDWQTLPTDRIYNITDGVSYSKVNPMLTEENLRLKGEGYVLVHLDQEMTMADGTTTKAVLAKKTDLKVEPLQREQIGYRAGGHRIYNGKYFAKQARIGVQPDGEKFLTNPGTFIVGNTKAEVQFWVDQMNAARLAYKSGAPTHVLDELLPANVSGEEFATGMMNGTFSEDVPFHNMFDREVLPEYVNTQGYADLRNADETNIEAYLRTTGRMFYGHKGSVLRDWQGELAPTLDPFQTINRALMNVANLSSFSDYKITAAERWHKTFGGYLNQTGLSPMSAVRDGTFGLNVPEAIRQSGEAQRDIIKRTLGWKTEFDRQQEIYTRRFAEWVAGDDPYSLRNKVTSSISNWFDNHHPVQALRGLAFDLKLGLFNVAQFPLQIGTLVAATTMSPKYGFQGMVGLFPMRAYLTKSGTEHMLDTLIERGVHKSVGMEAAEYKQFMKQAKDSGFFDIGGTHQLVAEGGPNAAVGAFKHIDNFRHATRFWFNEGEVWNRSVAWRIAWGETREKFPQLAVDSADFQRELAGKAEEFAFSMSEQSSAAWQKGITSIPTQFWAYNARMLEAMLGKTFTNEQKARLVIGQTLLYGSAGIPLAPLVSDKLKAKKGESPPINSAFAIVDRGMLDQVIYHMTGQDLLVSKRYGTGAFVSDTIKDLFGMSAFGEKSTAEMVAGATGSIAKDGFETILDIIKYASAESGGDHKPLTEDAVLRFAKNISTVSNVQKAYMVHKYGTLISNKGTTMAANLPSQTAFAVALGIAPGATDDVTAAMNYLKNDKEAVEELTKDINNYRTRMVNEPANREDLMEEINLRMKLAPPDVRIQAIRKAQTRMQPSLLDGIKLQVEKDRVRAEALKSMEETQ